MTVFWTTGERSALLRTIANVAAGAPGILVVEGDAGTGKSTLLDTLVELADGFVRCDAYGDESERVPFGVLRQFGVSELETADGGLLSPQLAAQMLKVVVEAKSGGRHVLLRLDDLQWADQETSESLVWLLRRMSGMRLLAAVAARPFAGQHSLWNRWVVSAPGVVRVRLGGLSFPAATELIGEFHPELDAGTVRRLWEHTSGNPLHLKELLSNHGSVDLSAVDRLPAPAAFETLVRSRLDELDGEAVDLARATAVLGTGWNPLRMAGAVAEVANLDNAAQTLIGAGLLAAQAGGAKGEVVVRPQQALVQAAVYAQMPILQKRQFHLAAAALVEDGSAALAHRFAASTTYDDLLAADLEALAGRLYGQRSYRLAARHLLHASCLTRDVDTRDHRRIRSFFNSALAHDYSAIPADAVADIRLRDPSAASLVEGAVAVFQSRWLDAIRLLSPVGLRTEKSGDDLTAYRSGVLLAWAQNSIVQPPELVAATLDHARSLPVRDSALVAYVDLTSFNSADRLIDAQKMYQLGGLPSQPELVPDEQTYTLIWRAELRFQEGFLVAAAADLREAQSRVAQHRVDDVLGGRLLAALLGHVYWFHGQWSVAGVHLGLSMHRTNGNDLADVEHSSSPDIVEATIGARAAAAALTSSAGFELADAMLDEAGKVLTIAPFRLGLYALIVSWVARLHAGGNQEQQSKLWPRVHAQWPEISFTTGVVGPTYLTHFALAAIWAHEFVEAESYLVEMISMTQTASWVNGASQWLRGLIAEHEADHHDALDYYQIAAGFSYTEIPILGAHILADLSRLAHDMGHWAESKEARNAALQIYRSLGASTYVDRLEAWEFRDDAATEVRDVMPIVTDRERAVLTLLIKGFSYQQIARELSVTKSAVNYHLSNLYLKLAVRSRHELAALVVQDPRRFGFAAPPLIQHSSPGRGI